MITPQQRNAWRGAYLRQLRKIASTSPLQEGWEEEYEFENALEAHLIRFTLNDFVLLSQCLSFIFENHPLAIAYIDKEGIKEQDRLSLEELFAFLQPLSNYAKYNVLEEISCDDLTREQMMSALIDNQEQLFIGLAKGCSNIMEICLLCGYTSKMILTPLSDSLQVMDGDLGEAEENEDTYLDELEDRYGKEFVDKFTGSNDIIEQVKKYSMFKLDILDEDLLPYYIVLVKFWMATSTIVDTLFFEKELSVFNNLIQESPSTEIYSDLERLVYLLYDFSPKRLFTPESYNFQELTSIKNQLLTN